MSGDHDPPIGEETDDEREIELSSIAAIFPELVIGPADPYSASIELAVTPIEPLLVRFPVLAETKGPSVPLTPPSSDAEEQSVDRVPEAAAVQDLQRLSHLPPLSLQIKLPRGYPAHEPPVFRLSTTPDWLPQKILEQLQDDGVQQWEDLGRDQAVYGYIDYLQQAAERAFDLTPGPNESVSLPQSLKISLLDFDLKTRREVFERGTFECGICLDPKKGASCHRLLQCSHVFCVQCLQAFYNNCITEGDVASVKCLDPSCAKNQETPPARKQKKKRTKEFRTLNPSELLQIPLEPDMVKRYVDLTRKAKLESDQTTVYCPRKWCQGPARWEKSTKTVDIASSDGDSDDEIETHVWKDGDPAEKMPPPSERVAICEDCSYAFCRVCLAGWHGELGTCWPRSTAEISAEEKASQEYMRKHSSLCPTCNAPCQKTSGCNHMICFKCRSHFCYLCSSWLEEENPYKHFNNPHGSCHMRLWELEGGDGEDAGEPAPRGVAAAAGVAPPQPAPQANEIDDAQAAALLQLERDIQDRRQRLAEMDVEVGERLAELANLQRALDAAQPLNARRGEADREHAEGEAPAARRRLAPFPRDGVLRERLERVGLQRFLRMVENDEEDEWDSDEMDDEEGPGGGDWEIPVR